MSENNFKFNVVSSSSDNTATASQDEPSSKETAFTVISAIDRILGAVVVDVVTPLVADFAVDATISFVTEKLAAYKKKINSKGESIKALTYDLNTVNKSSNSANNTDNAVSKEAVQANESEVKGISQSAAANDTDANASNQEAQGVSTTTSATNVATDGMKMQV